jgi:phosphate transport system substrate-binding protein
VNSTSIRAGAKVALPLAATLVLGLALTGCGAANESGATAAQSDGPTLSGTLDGAGSSAQEAVQGAWQSGFQTAHPDVTVNYDPVGSGGGREQFLAGGVDFAGSDSYLDDDELAASKEVCNGATAIEVPDYVSPIALVYNQEGVDDLRLSATTVAGIFDGKITTWDDDAIKAENPDADLPGDRIVPVHRSDDSGTTDNFTQYLSAAGEGAWTHEPDGLWPVKSGEGAQGTSGVIEAVTNGKGTIGYADESQAGDLSVASIKVGDAYVAPAADAASKVVDVSPRVEGRAENDLAIDVDRTTTEAGAYPLVLVSYVIACPTYDDAAKADLVKSYLTYVLGTTGQKAAAEAAGSAPLSTEFGKDAVAAVDAITAKS